MEIGDTVRILDNALTQIKKYEKMKVTSLKKILSYSMYQKYVTSDREKNFNGLWKYKLNGFSAYFVSNI